MKKLLVGITILLLSACSTVTDQHGSFAIMEKSNIQKLQKGKTTKKEIVQIFGQPDGEGVGTKGETVMVYHSYIIKNNSIVAVPVIGDLYMLTKNGGTYKKSANLELNLDKRNILQDYKLETEEK